MSTQDKVASGLIVAKQLDIMNAFTSEQYKLRATS